jgi:PKD repeat protein
MIRRGLAALVALAALVTPALVPATAGADSVPPEPGTPTTATADALPTVQMNGVAWDQVIVGNTVYVAGSFTRARPAGAAAGTNETVRNNLLAYNLTTGALVTSWAPTLNAQAMTISASADGTTIYVGGDFTQANSTARNRIAAFDATTGALRSFNPGANSRVNDIAVNGATVYYAGSFTVSAGQARARAAAVDATTGALRPWAPTADQELVAIVVIPSLNKVVLGGRLTQLNGVENRGMGAVDATTGATLPWPVNRVITNWGRDASINSLSVKGTQVFGTGYTYLVNGVDSGNFEGIFAADGATGELQWVNGCRGDTYDAFPVGDVVYNVSHHHDCGPVGGLPQTEPWTYQYAQASTTYASPDGAVNTSGAFSGRPASELLHWLPTFSMGSFTGMYQAGWTVEANDQYVVIGGEFPRVNGVNQYGLVRFAVSDIAPDTQGPQGTAQSAPSLVGIAPGTLRVAWTSAWDRDNQRLTYEVLRGATVGSSVVVRTLTADSTWWSRPRLSFTDTTAPPGSTQTYRIRIKDPFGNTVTTSSASGAVPSGSATASAYRSEVVTDGPTRYWRLGESAATVAYDQIGADDLTLNSSSQRGASGALLNETTEAATTFPGNVQVAAGTTGSPLPGPDQFAVEAWFRTTTTSGGKIVGFGNSATGASNNYDRHVYMANDGRVYFGVYDGNTRIVGGGSPLNDGQWHHVVAMLGDDGTKLYVDGRLTGADPTATIAQAYSGFWRIGGDSLGGWPNQPSSNSFQGTIDEVATYAGPLSQDRVRAHYVASGRAPSWPQAPQDAYGAAVWANDPSLFLRLDETSGTDAVDRATNAVAATYAGGVVLDQPPSPANPAGRSISLDGNAARVVANSLTANPQTFSLEAWFRTTSTEGGRILGFGCSQDEASGCYDRHIYMRDDGRLRYGVWIGQTVTIDSPASYNDGQWHHVVVSNQPGTQNMYVDGVLVGSASSPDAQAYTGAWRVGSDNIWDGASTKDLRGQVDEVAVYPTSLSQSDVAAHWIAAGGGVPNQAPTAAFTSSATDLTASFNGSSSSDPDGSIASYSWDFGDGSPAATGATAQRTYAAAGTYTVTLTVTDDEGATDTETAQVTVTAPSELARDTFTRTLASGWGTADLGGAWTVAGNAANYSVSGGVGRLTATGPASQRSAYLNTLQQSSTDVTAAVSVGQAPTGGGVYTTVVGRSVAGNSYGLKLRFNANGTVDAFLSRVVGGVETNLQTRLGAVTGYMPGQVLRVRLQVTGTGTTGLAMKVWRDGTVEPATWLAQSTDTTASLQAAGAVGIVHYLSGSASVFPVVLSVDDFVVRPPAL